MAKIEFIHPEDKDIPASTETIEVRVWALGGTKEQPFYIGSGLNFQANTNIWLEFIYSVEGAHILYTRNFIQQGFFNGEDGAIARDRQLDEIIQNGEGSFGFGDMLPDTRLSKFVNHSMT